MIVTGTPRGGSAQTRDWLVVGLASFGSVMVLVSAILPWKYVYTCNHGMDGCAPSVGEGPVRTGWNVFQLGGSFDYRWVPSAVTTSAAVVVSCGLLLLLFAVLELVGASERLGSGNRIAWNATIAALAAFIALTAGLTSVFAPDPHAVSGFGDLIPWWWTTVAVGTWICGFGALVCLLASLLALRRSSSRGKRPSSNARIK